MSIQFAFGSKVVGGLGTKDGIEGVISKSIPDIYFLSDFKIKPEKVDEIESEAFI